MAGHRRYGRREERCGRGGAEVGRGLFLNGRVEGVLSGKVTLTASGGEEGSRRDGGGGNAPGGGSKEAVSAKALRQERV